MKRFMIAVLLFLAACGNGTLADSAPSPTASSRPSFSPTPSPTEHSRQYCRAHPHAAGCPSPKPPKPSPEPSPLPKPPLSPKPDPDRAAEALVCGQLDPAIFGPPSTRDLAIAQVDAWYPYFLHRVVDRFYVLADVGLLHSSTHDYPTPAAVHSDAERLATDCGHAGFPVP